MSGSGNKLFLKNLQKNNFTPKFFREKKTEGEEGGERRKNKVKEKRHSEIPSERETDKLNCEN